MLSELQLKLVLHVNTRCTMLKAIPSHLKPIDIKICPNKIMHVDYFCIRVASPNNEKITPF